MNSLYTLNELQLDITVQQLPEEIILRIVDHLDTPPVSVILRHQVPSSALFIRSGPECGLKTFSRVCQDWRRISFPFLFKHIKISADFLISRVLNPVEDPRNASRNSNYNAEALSLKFDECRLQRSGCFFEWAQNKELNTITESVLLYVTESSPSCIVEDTEDGPGIGIGASVRRFTTMREINCKQLYHWLYSRLMTLFQPQHIILVAPPPAIANMLGTEVYLSDVWAFDLPFQRLDLRLGRAGKVKEASRAVHGRLLEYADWTEVNYHPGSCLNLYGTFERGDRHQDHYFDKYPPCIVAPETSPFLDSSSPRLTSFTYRQVFPHLLHFRKVLAHLVRLDSLQHVAFQLAPAADSGILDDTAMISHGHLRLRDCWMEVERGYTEAARVLLGNKMRDVNGKLEEIPGMQEKALPLLKQFTSYDCDTAVIKDDLDKVFQQSVMDWECAGVGRWVLSDQTS